MPEVVYRPHPAQAKAHVDTHKRKLLFWGRQVGKTMWSVNHAYIEAVKKQGNYFIVFKTYTQAHQVVWKQYLTQIPESLRKVSKINNDELSITFPYLKGKVILPGGEEVLIEHDTSQPPSSIRLLGSDQAESHRGIKAHGIIFDEYADQNPDNWDAVYQPMFSTTDGWAAFLSTPKGYNHWEQLVREAQDHPELWYYSEATWRDNPMITKQFIDGVREEAVRRNKLSTFLQEYELEFRSVEGAVYPDFDRKIHVVKPKDIPTEGVIYAGVDFGFENPTAVCFMIVDYAGIHWQWDEIYVTHTTINDLADIIWAKLGDRKLTLMVGDSAQAEHIANLQSKGFPIVPVSKIRDSIQLGINLISQQLKPRIQLAGPPKPSTFIGSNCIHTIYEFEQYKYPENKNDLNPKEIPLKANDHMCFVAQTLITTDKGEVPIYKVKPGMEVLTTEGYKPVLRRFNNGKQRVQKYRLHFDTFSVELECTPDHLIRTQLGWTPIAELNKAHKIYLDKSLMAEPTTYMQVSVTTQNPTTDYILTYGYTTTDPSQKDITFTMKTTTPGTTPSTTSSSLNLTSTSRPTFKPGLKPILNGLSAFRLGGLKRLKLGTKVQKAMSGTFNTAKIVGWINRFTPKSVNSVASRTKQEPLAPPSSAIKTAKLRRLELGAKRTVTVYDLEVEDTHEYLANGVLAHNCDARRYLELYLRYDTGKKEAPIKAVRKFNRYGLL